jgi:TRAP-type C4-dicarboxylate transport system permease small subunit
MVVIAFLQVILRNFFSFSILWGDPLLRHLVLWIGFLGASLATREDRHINIDALYRILRPTWQPRVRFVTNLFSAFVSGFLVRAAFVFVRDEFSAQSTLFLGIPLGLFVSIILIGFIVITLRFLLKALFPFQANSSSAEVS